MNAAGEIWAGRDCCFYRIRLPAGFPLLGITNLAGNEEGEYLLPYTMDSNGIMKAYAMKINEIITIPTTTRYRTERQLIDLSPIPWSEADSKSSVPADTALLLSRLFSKDELSRSLEKKYERRPRTYWQSALGGIRYPELTPFGDPIKSIRLPLPGPVRILTKELAQKLTPAELLQLLTHRMNDYRSVVSQMLTRCSK